MRLTSLTAGLLLLACASAHADTVYKWKDANGVTQYSEHPPKGQKFETRRITHSGASIPVTEEASASSESPQCTDARRNLELLAGKAPVMQDTDGDGKADAALDAGQRESQKNLADAAVKAYCKAPAEA